MGGIEVASSTRLFEATSSHYDTGLPREAAGDLPGSPLVSPGAAARGGDVTFASAVYAGDFDDIEDEIETIVEFVAAAAAASGLEIPIGGDGTIAKQRTDLSDEDFGFASLVNLPLTLVIMLLAMGGLAAAGVPILIAYLGVAMTAGVVTLFSRVVPMEPVWIQVVLLMGLAAGIDYTLFLFTRYRYERAQGRAPDDAAAIASHTAGRGVLIAALTTMLAVLGMFFIGFNVFDSLGLAAFITILVALLVALTLTPAVLGDGLNRWTVPRIGRRYNIAQAGSLNALAGRVVQASTNRPWLWGTLALGAMIALIYPMVTLNLGFNGVRSLNDDVDAKAAIVALEENFTIGVLSPALVIVDPGEGRNIFAPAVQEQVNRLQDLVVAENERAAAAGEHVPFAQPFDTSINEAGDTERLEIPINADTGDQDAVDAVNLLRDELIPAAFTDGSTRALVTGATAFNIDFKDSIDTRTPIVVAFVVVTAFLILVALYRSLVVPLIAVVLNLLAVTAAYGLLVLVFQEGYALEGLLDFEATGIVESWLPLFVFTITFGISMDYLTFAIGRMQELYTRGASTDEAIVEGVGERFGIVLSAAAIMIAVATVFAFTRDIGLQQFGFTLAVAVLLDTTIILLVLLPAMMRLAHAHLWYLPRWLDWIPGGPTRVPEREREERAPAR